MHKIPGPDYRILLLKYFCHVGECEGVDFLRGPFPSAWFTKEEWAVMRALSRVSVDKAEELKETL